MGTSLGRKRGRSRKAYTGFLRSGAWFRRREAWFTARRAEGVEPACQGCGTRLDETGTLDLHHVSYARVGQERNEDLWPFCRRCHEWIHEVFDRRAGDLRGWDRRQATIWATVQLRRFLEREGSWS